MKAIFLIGVSASGKSTFVETYKKDNSVVDIERDKVRKEILIQTNPNYNPTQDNMWKFWKFTKSNETEVTLQCEAIRETAIALHHDIIFSNTNLNQRNLQKEVDYMKSKGYTVELKYFPIEYETVVQRDKSRLNSVGQDVINKQWLEWLKLPAEYTGIKKYEKDTFKQKAIIVDIDGTLAAHVNRSPYEWDKVITDAPIKEIIDLVRRYVPTHKVIFVSGRDSVCRNDTLLWLNKFFKVTGEQLFMRPEGSTVKDSIVKNDIFWNYIEPNYCVELVIDDRKQVIRLWTDISYCKNSFKLIDVGNYYEDF